MATQSSCERCGAPLSAFSAPGLCPSCLLRGGLMAGLMRESGSSSSENIESGVAPEGWRPPPGTEEHEASGTVDTSAISNEGSETGALGRFGDYELIAQIARGGMGVVYEAYHLSLNRVVALKMILSERLAGPGAVERFQIEAEAAARLEHPNIVPIYEIGQRQGAHYYSMRLVEGGNLREALRDGPLPVVRAAELMATMARAMHYAHQRGVLHRDLKPANVLLDSAGQPQITDFGLAKLSARGPDLTRSSMVIGTPNYMAPEQAAGRSREVTAAADIYSLGAILYEMLTARPPFYGETEMEVLRQVLEDVPPMPHSLRPKLDRSLETICLKCLEKDPRARYGTAEELASDLQRWLRHEPIHARQTQIWERAAKWVRRRPLHASLAGVIGLSAIVAGLLWSEASRQRAQVTVAASQNELEEIEQLFANQNSAAALARLARLCRIDPANSVAATRLLATLSQRTFALPLADLTQGDEILAAHYSPDARWVVTTSRDHTTCLWDARTGNLARALVGHRKDVRCARFSSDSLRVATGSADGTARVWEVASGRALAEFPNHESAVRCVEFTPDRKSLMTVATNIVRIWDIDSGRIITRIIAGEDIVHDAQLSPDGEKIVTASHDGTVQVWHTRSGEPVSQPLRHKAPVRTVRFSPNGQRLVTASDDETARIWSPETGAELRLLHAGVVSSAEFSPDGERVVTACHDGSVSLWDVETGSQLPGGFKHQKQVNYAVFSPDGQKILSASDDGTAQLFDAQTFDARTCQPLAEPVQAGQFVENAAFSPDGTQFLTLASESRARLWRIPGPTLLARPIPRSEGVSWIEFSPNGESAVTVSGRAMQLWNARSGLAMNQPELFNLPIQMAQFDSDGTRLLIATRECVQICNVAALRAPLITLRMDTQLQAADFSPDRQWIATVSGNTARIWDTRTGTPTRWQFRHDDLIESAHFSPDSQRLVTASRDRTARVWEIRTGQVVVLPHSESLLVAEFSKDGRRVATGTTDGTVRIWELRTPRQEGPALHHQGEVNSVAFSPDNQRLVTAAADQTIRVWDIRTAQELTEPLLAGERVWGARFTTDGKWIVTRSGLMWEVPSVSTPSPVWLAQLAEAVGGSRFDHENLVLVPVNSLWALAHQIETAGEIDTYHRWAKWLLADWQTRTISPSAVMTVPEYVERQLAANTLESLQEAKRLAPTNTRVRAQLSRMVSGHN